MARAVGDFSVDNPGVNEVFGFDFVYNLAEGDALNQAIPPVWTCAAVIGVDPSAATHVIGNAVFSNATTVLQRATGFVAGVTYALEATVKTIFGDTLVLWALLPVQPVGC